MATGGKPRALPGCPALAMRDGSGGGSCAAAAPINAAGVAGTAQVIVAEAVLRSEDEDLGLEQGVGLVKCSSEVSLSARSAPRRELKE